MRRIMTMDEAESILSPWFLQIANCVKKGFTDYVDMIGYDSYSKNRFLKMHPRTRATMIHNLVAERISEGFKDVPEVVVKEIRGVFGLYFKNQAFIRFKKFNSRLAPAKSSTRQGTRIENHQTVIPGFPRRPTILYAGYTFNQSMTAIAGIYISSRAKECNWVLDISRFAAAEQQTIPFASVNADRNKKRVTVKAGLQLRKIS
jgi:hypothetical protein